MDFIRYKDLRLPKKFHCEFDSFVSSLCLGVLMHQTIIPQPPREQFLNLVKGSIATVSFSFSFFFH